MYDGLIGEWQGPVVWWQPVLGERHALAPEQRPLPGQERETVCGLTVTLGVPSSVDWLLPTCDECWSQALTRSEARAESAREHRAPAGGDAGAKGRRAR